MNKASTQKGNHTIYYQVNAHQLNQIRKQRQREEEEKNRVREESQEDLADIEDVGNSYRGEEGEEDHLNVDESNELFAKNDLRRRLELGNESQLSSS